MGHENRFIKNTVSSREICTEPLPKIPLIEICDRRRVLIENHKGIIAYGCNEIIIKAKYGQICVSGENLKVSKMSRERIVIIGTIQAVTMQGRD